MKQVIYLFLLAAGIVLAGCNQSHRVLVVVGGHAYDTAEFYDMFRALEDIGFDSVSHPRAMDMLASEQVKDYDVLLFYDFLPNMSLMDSAIYLELTQSGVPLLFMHHSLCNFQDWDGYRQMVGGKYLMDGFGFDSSELSDYAHDLDLEVQILDPQHPIAKGLEDFQIHDEGYSNIQISPDIHPLFGTPHPQSSPLMGWAHKFQNSSVVYLMFGHDKLAYENESLRQILVNTVNWLSKQ